MKPPGASLNEKYAGSADLANTVRINHERTNKLGFVWTDFWLHPVSFISLHLPKPELEFKHSATVDIQHFTMLCTIHKETRKML